MPLRGHLRCFDWHGRIRLQSRCWSSRGGHRPCTATRLALALGDARFWPHVYLTTVPDGPVPLACARSQARKDEWCRASDKPTDRHTFEASRLRCAIEANGLDDQAHGCQPAWINSWRSTSVQLSRSSTTDWGGISFRINTARRKRSAAGKDLMVCS